MYVEIRDSVCYQAPLSLVAKCQKSFIHGLVYFITEFLKMFVCVEIRKWIHICLLLLFQDECKLLVCQAVSPGCRPPSAWWCNCPGFQRRTYPQCLIKAAHPLGTDSRPLENAPEMKLRTRIHRVGLPQLVSLHWWHMPRREALACRDNRQW